MNAVLWLLNFSNSLPKEQWVLIFTSPWFRHLSASSQWHWATVRVHLGVGQRGPFFLEIILYYFYRILRTIKRFYIAGKWASVPATLFWIFWIHPWQMLVRWVHERFLHFFIIYLETKDQFQHTANNTKCTCMYWMPYQNGINCSKDSS